MPSRQEKDTPRPSVVNMTKHLQGIDFPCSKQDLIRHAKQHGLDQSVLDMLERLEDREYESMKEVMKEYGKNYPKAA
jgi:hypothetical protein